MGKLLWPLLCMLGFHRKTYLVSRGRGLVFFCTRCRKPLVPHG
jgi:hypothetical protein